MQYERIERLGTAVLTDIDRIQLRHRGSSLTGRVLEFDVGAGTVSLLAAAGSAAQTIQTGLGPATLVAVMSAFGATLPSPR